MSNISDNRPTILSIYVKHNWQQINNFSSTNTKQMLIMPIYLSGSFRDSICLTKHKHMHIIIPLWEFFLHQLMVFHWSLRDCKSFQISWTFPSILVNLNNGWSLLDLLFPSLPLASFRDCPKCTNFNWYQRHLHFP